MKNLNIYRQRKGFTHLKGEMTKLRSKRKRNRIETQFWWLVL